MKEKLSMSKKGWYFTALFFLFAVYYTLSKAHYAAWKSVHVSFHLMNSSTIFNSLLYAGGLLLFYVICTLLPSRRVVILPSIITLMLAAQEFVIAYYTLPASDWLGSIVLLVGTLVILGMAYVNTLISFTVINGVQQFTDNHYLISWWHQVINGLSKHWKLLAINICLYILINSSLIITITIK